MGGNWTPPEDREPAQPPEPPTVDDWLDSEFIGPAQQGGDPRRIKTIDLIAELIGVNGGLDIHQWGMIGYTPNHPWGRSGLTQEEALLLRFFDGVLTGVRLTNRAKAQEIVDRLMAITEAKMAEAKQAQAAGGA